MKRMLENGLSTYDIMCHLNTHLESIGFPFKFNQLMVFEAIIDEYKNSSQSVSILTFLSLENVLKLRLEKKTGMYSLEEFDRLFAMLTGAQPSSAVMFIENAKERYRHAVTIIMTLQPEVCR